MNYKKVFKRETKVIVYVVIALALVVIGTSYALFLQVDNNSNNQIVKAGNLTITYSQGNVINAGSSKGNCLTPQSDSAATSGACKYTLSIANTGSLPMQYNLLIYDDTSVSPLVGHNYIKHTLTKQISKTDSTTNQTISTNKFLSSLSTSNSKRILETNTINAGETITFSLNIWISDTATVDIINKYVSLKLDVVGSVSETENGNYALPVCKRATTLHTQTCTNDCQTACKGTEGNGTIVRYGNLGTSGVLTSGDAFDCDVNGDGAYDATTERFYLLRQVSNGNLRLIYYNNTVDGIPSSASGTYDQTNLPNEEQWKNVSAIGLANLEDVKIACDTTDPTSANSLDKCIYLLENTYYYVLGNPVYILEDGSYIGPYRHVVGIATIVYRGVRPVIEVPLKNVHIN